MHAFEGKVAIMTRAESGLGEVVARRFATIRGVVGLATQTDVIGAECAASLADISGLATCQGRFRDG